jgi:hypothetical protein
MLKHLGYYHIEGFRDEAISNDRRAELRHLTLPSPEMTKFIIIAAEIPRKEASKGASRKLE